MRWGIGSRTASRAVVRPIANDTRIWPAGYMWASATDLSRALFALMHQGRIGDRQVLPKSVVDAVMTPHTPLPNIFVGGHYGYGLMIARDRGELMYEHGGTLPGFSSILRFAPERGVGIAILSNLDNAPLRRIAQSVLGKVLALPEQPPAVRKETPSHRRRDQAISRPLPQSRDRGVDGARTARHVDSGWWPADGGHAARGESIPGATRRKRCRTGVRVACGKRCSAGVLAPGALGLRKRVAGVRVAAAQGLITTATVFDGALTPPVLPARTRTVYSPGGTPS